MTKTWGEYVSTMYYEHINVFCEYPLRSQLPLEICGEALARYNFCALILLPFHNSKPRCVGPFFVHTRNLGNSPKKKVSGKDCWRRMPSAQVVLAKIDRSHPSKYVNRPLRSNAQSRENNAIFTCYFLCLVSSLAWILIPHADKWKRTLLTAIWILPQECSSWSGWS